MYETHTNGIVLVYWVVASWEHCKCGFFAVSHYTMLVIFEKATLIKEIRDACQNRIIICCEPAFSLKNAYRPEIYFGRDVVCVSPNHGDLYTLP